MISANQIKMGNDEFILYIRKNTTSCSLTNDQLGKQIWQWLKSKGATKVQEDKPCFWETHGASIDAELLPKTSAQFEFDRALLPELFTYLDELKEK